MRLTSLLLGSNKRTFIRKERSIPLWPKTAQILKEWFREIDAREDAMAFPNVRRAPLTRFAVHLLLRKAVQAASMRCPSLTGKRVSPHVIRHGTAMALLQAGVDLYHFVFSTKYRKPVLRGDVATDVKCNA
jgi:site-specific recombinase XerD